jgi:hypothetical protein
MKTIGEDVSTLEIKKFFILLKKKIRKNHYQTINLELLKEKGTPLREEPSLNIGNN